MDVQKDGKKFKAAFYLLPFVLMLCGCLNFIIFVAKFLPASTFAAFAAFHLLFLLSLSAVFGNVAIETCLAMFENRKDSSLHDSIYGGRRFLPVRPAVFVAVFIACYIFLTQLLPYIGSFKLLILIVPSFAVFMNAPHFISGRVRFINGRYMLYQGNFSVLFSYYIDEHGFLVFVTEEGKLLKTDAMESDMNFKAIEAEFLKNGLKSGNSKL